MILGLPRFKNQRTFKESQAMHLNKRFQARYVSLLTISLVVCSSIFLLAAYYFTDQNQELFKGLAFEYYPSMVKHIERENKWLLLILFFSLGATALSTVWITKRMTSNLINPLIEMEKHMRLLVSGDWEKSTYRFSESKDFKELSLTYDYLVLTLKTMTEQEMEMLLRMRLDPHDKETLHTWSELINQKRKRLGLRPISALSLETDAKPNLRRVS